MRNYSIPSIRFILALTLAALLAASPAGQASAEQSPSPLMTPNAWNALGSGLNGTALAIAVDGTDIYAGGAFTNAGGNANADYIAKWDGTSWSALGTGLNGIVRTIVVNGSDIYVGGNFTDAGGDSNADYIAKWDGASWSTLGTGLNDRVQAIAVSGSDVYVGGDFTDAGGNANADYIAKLDGDSWEPVGATPLSNVVNAIVINGGEVYAGGSFLNASGDANADRIAKWNGSSWTALGSGLNQAVNAVVLHGGEVYAGGGFTDAGGNAAADYIARWNGTSWSDVGGSLIGSVSTIATHGTDLYVGGIFTNAGGDANADKIARWDGTSWFALGTTPLNATVNRIVINGMDLYAGGEFTDAGGDANADRIARFEIHADVPTVDSFSATSPSTSVNIPITAFTASDNVAVTGYKITESSTPPAASDAGWSASAPTTYSVSGNGNYTLYPWAKDAAGNVSAVYGSPASVTVISWNALGSGLNGTAFAIAIDGMDIYAGGSFTDAGGDANADYIAKWDGDSWSALGTGLNATVRTIVVNGSDIYVGGDFTDAGGNPDADRIAKWNGTSWSALGTGLNASVHVIAVSGSNVYVGGAFTNASGNANADYIAKLDGDTWESIGPTPLNGTVRSAFVSGGEIYAGGHFTDAGGDSNADYIAKWNGSSWTALGSGLNGDVYAVVLHGGEVYAGGEFGDIGGNLAADFIAKWDGTSWSVVGGGLQGHLRTIATDGTDIYAGGYFSDAGGDANADYIAKWDGTSWSALSTTPLDNPVNRIVINGTDLYAGGQFTDASGNANADRIARFEIDATDPTVDLFSATSPSTSLNVPITAFTASDNVIVTGYKITESSTPPAASDAGWSASAPTTYTVAGNGNYTLYPWAKDAAGNVSAVYGSPASVTVDTTAPTVTSFSAPSSSTSLTISITAFTASDNVAVTGYKITGSSTPPAAGAAGWTASAPTTYTVPGSGNFTLYPWAKDAAGNVSAVYGSPASVTVDATAPTVTSFSAPSFSTSLNVPITTFTASDNVAVTGYKITGSSTPPSAGAAGWTASALSSYTVPGSGNYTLYPWAKDAAGNVSAVYGSPASVTVDATAPTVTSFSAPSSSNSLDIPITAFTASDNVAVTGYKITESSTPPSAGAAGWTASALSSYTVPGSGNYTLYPWAKDAAGNVSAVYGSPVAVTVCLSGTITVTSNADSGAGTLRKAISDACAGSTINFNSALLGGTIRLNSTLILSKDVTIDGSALTSPVSISGDSDNNGSGNVRVFDVNTGVTAALDSLIITKGLAVDENGAGIYNRGALTVTNSSFIDQLASWGYGGAIFNDGTLGGVLTVANSTFSGNYMDGYGGAIANYNGTVTITNSTISDNFASERGGGIAQLSGGTMTIRNSTISGNAGNSGGGVYVDNNAGTLNIINTIIANSTSGGDCFLGSGATLGTNINNLVEDGSCSASLSGDPSLDVLADNGGPTQTMALGAGSPGIDAGDNTNCPPTDQRGVTRPYGSHCDLGAYEAEYGSIDVTIGNSTVGSYLLAPHESQRKSYLGVNNGPVKIIRTDNVSITAAERVIYKVNGVNTSFTEMMGLPNSQLDTTYWLPWYNNVDLDTQLRFANVSGSTATVHVYIGGVEMNGSPLTLEAGASTRKSFPGINDGPVEIVSDQDIVAAERVIYKVNGVNTSFSEMMALPNSQLDTTYWLPWYNNVDLDTQLRFANTTDQTATVHVYIGGVEMQDSPFTLAAGESTRKSFPGINSGPVEIVSDQDIVAAERVIYKVNGVNTSFTEMMALPNSQLDTTYWLPWYNNKDLDTQLRFANTTDQTATVHVYIGGVEMQGSPFTLAAGESTRKSFPNINSGPVQIVSDQNIVAAERVIYKVNGVNTSFSEMMALPNTLLDTMYWFPWYNNVDLDTQLRFGVP